MRRAFIYGLLIAVAGAILTFIIGNLEYETQQLVGWIGLIFPVIGIVLAIRSAKREETGEFTFGDGFKVGAATTVVYALFSGIFAYLYYSMINPEALETAREAVRKQFVEQGLTGRELEQSVAMSQGMMTPTGTTILGVVTAIIVGLIISLIAAAFMRRKADPASYA